MTQTILVYIIIILSVAYSAYAVYKNIRKKETSPCGDCNGCDIKKEITKNMKYAAPNAKTCVSKNPDTCGCSPK
ncbi:MAG: FeoB-associated Cys-rich membrane protein [Paludibacter sp.]|nr:FeoB-associated Cys-rich membrane protein [Paludibacter sp.]